MAQVARVVPALKPAVLAVVLVRFVRSLVVCLDSSLIFNLATIVMVKVLLSTNPVGNAQGMVESRKKLLSK
jgi:hypothetical protein